MKVMSVDDSKAMRDLVHNVIDLLGFDFLEASDGAEALRLLEGQQGKVDLILMDINMPVMDGMATLKVLKSDPRYREIPVTMVTMETEKDSIVEAIAGGARNYVMKPFTQEELVGKIMESLGLGDK